jgi:hypothetical protein
MESFIIYKKRSGKDSHLFMNFKRGAQHDREESVSNLNGTHANGRRKETRVLLSRSFVCMVGSYLPGIIKG